MVNGTQKKIERLEKRIHDHTADPVDMLDLGKLYFISSRFDDAIDMYRRLLAADTGNVAGYYNLGIAYQARKMETEAKEMFRKVLELDPDNTAAQEALDRMMNFQSGG